MIPNELLDPRVCDCTGPLSYARPQPFRSYASTRPAAVPYLLCKLICTGPNPWLQHSGSICTFDGSCDVHALPKSHQTHDTHPQTSTTSPTTSNPRIRLWMQMRHTEVYIDGRDERGHLSQAVQVHRRFLMEFQAHLLNYHQPLSKLAPDTLFIHTGARLDPG